MKKERRYDIDWIRVIAIALLLIYHTAIVFQPWATMIFFMQSNESLQGLWTIMSMLNVWRIPLLFFVSGMGVYFAIQRRDWLGLIKERAKRILLPFVFGCLVICPIHALIFVKYYDLPFNYMINSGHLWFLGNIVCYILVLSPVFFYLKKYPNGLLRKGLSKLMRFAFGPLILASLSLLEVLLVEPGAFELYAQNWHGFFLGLSCFLVGYLFMFSGQVFWSTLSKWTFLYLSLGLVLYVNRIGLFGTSSNMYLTAIESNLWILGVFGLGYRYLNKSGALLSYLSKAAYPVYIIHMAVLYLGCYLILPLEINPMLQFIGINVFNFILCFLVYEFILKPFDIIRPLFGLGKRSTQTNKVKLEHSEILQ